jgi:CheY-like chemotaxis protein
MAMSEGKEEAIRVAVVDSDEVNRRGLTCLLAEHPRVKVVASLTHEEALMHLGPWPEAEVTLVGADDERARDDRFPGVWVVERIRRSARRPTRIVVTTGRASDHALRRRLAEANADLLYDRAALGEAAALYQVVLSPPPGQRLPPPDPQVLLRYGVTSASRVNRAVAFAMEHELPFSLQEPRSRRAWLRLRREFNAEARLSPMNANSCPPDREQQLPSLPQIVRFLAWATGTGDPEGLGSGRPASPRPPHRAPDHPPQSCSS